MCVYYMISKTFTEKTLEVGDHVEHVRDSNMIGVITVVEDNRLSVMVRWKGYLEDDFQWANNLKLKLPES